MSCTTKSKSRSQCPSLKSQTKNKIRIRTSEGARLWLHFESIDLELFLMSLRGPITHTLSTKTKHSKSLNFNWVSLFSFLISSQTGPTKPLELLLAFHFISLILCNRNAFLSYFKREKNI